MNKSTSTLALLALLAATPAYAAIYWTGGHTDDSFFSSDNWDFSSSTLTAGTFAEPLADHATITGATINEPGGSFSNLDIGEGFSVTLDGTSFMQTNANGFRGVVGGVDEAMTLINGSSLNGQFVSNGLAVSLNGGSSLTLRGGGGAIGGSGVTIDILDATSGLIFTAKTAAEAVSQYSGFISVNGAASIFGADPLVLEAGDNAFIVENGASGADNVTVFAVAVPEPSSAALLGLAGLALILRRRK